MNRRLARLLRRLGGGGGPDRVIVRYRRGGIEAARWDILCGAGTAGEVIPIGTPFLFTTEADVSSQVHQLTIDAVGGNNKLRRERDGTGLLLPGGNAVRGAAAG
jgi:hypothetical protein